MQEWLDNIDILMYSTHNEGKSVIAEMFIKTLKSKIYKKVQLMIKLVDKYYNTYHHDIHEKPMNADYSALTENIETNPKAPKF